jgi:hypothetical protein
MKKLIFILILVLPFLGKAQAHLGVTLASIKELYPDKKFKVWSYNGDSSRCASTDMSYGNFTYYFGNDGLSFMCTLVPKSLTALNAQVENYNKKYVILSETSWKAYLEQGEIMKINLEYMKEQKENVFFYTK